MKRFAPLALGLLLAACGGTAAPAGSPAPSSPAPGSSTAASPAASSAAGSQAAPASAAPASSSAAASAAASSGSTTPAGTIVFGTVLAKPDLDPHNTGAPQYTWLYPIFDGLTQVNDDRKVEPALAASWRNVDPMTWEF